jgi:hypothetical protein
MTSTSHSIGRNTIQRRGSSWASIEQRWDELINRGLVRATTFDRYILMPLGWTEGLKVAGAFDDPEFKEKAGLLSSALKTRVKSRQEPDLADRNDLADETGLHEYFVYNAIDTHRLRELFD